MEIKTTEEIIEYSSEQIKDYLIVLNSEEYEKKYGSLYNNTNIPINELYKKWISVDHIKPKFEGILTEIHNAYRDLNEALDYNATEKRLNEIRLKVKEYIKALEK